MKRRALISVSDKTGVAEFASKLVGMGFEIISTGGTAKALKEQGINVTLVSEVTGEPEILGGRVKTLHPKIHGGILADLEDPGHIHQLVQQGIGPIDLVCVNLYPFEAAVAGGASGREAIEQIDIGGPAMLRAAAKNYRSVTVIPSPEFYNEVLSELEADRQVSEDTRRRLALTTFRRTSEYDAAIAGWMEGEEEFPELLTLRYKKALPLRYGENPHQRAAYYAGAGDKHLLSDVRKVQGKDLSFNNLYDVDAARTLLRDLGEGSAAVIVKHANPCGAAVGENLLEAYRKALASDPVSAFGGIMALNVEVDRELAAEIVKVFTEVLIAPGFSPEALEIFEAKPNMTLLQAAALQPPVLSSKTVTGGMLLQETDVMEGASDYRIATKIEPSPEQMHDLLFAWHVAMQVKSNAIVLAKEGATVGIGAGQMSRVDSAEIAVKKAGGRAHGAAAASDAFFPFADGVEVLAEAGIAALIQPGGSKRDGEVIQAAEKHGIAMVFTGRRHFLH